LGEPLLPVCAVPSILHGQCRHSCRSTLFLQPRGQQHCRA
jgi:hypothetical protein